MAWEMRVQRLGLQQHADEARTYGTYQVVINGTSDVNLAGHICECTGLGDNTSNGVHNRRRIHEGSYDLLSASSP